MDVLNRWLSSERFKIPIVAVLACAMLWLSAVFFLALVQETVVSAVEATPTGTRVPTRLF